MLAASAALYLTAFVRETNPRTAILPALGDPPKQKWWRRLMNTKTSVVEAGRFVMNSKVLSKVAVIAFCSGVAEGTMSIGLMVKLTLEATLTHSIHQPDSFSSVHISLKHMYNMSLIG
jgi:hypothetical protein